MIEVNCLTSKQIFSLAAIVFLFSSVAFCEHDLVSAFRYECSNESMERLRSALDQVVYNKRKFDQKSFEDLLEAFRHVDRGCLPPDQAIAIWNLLLMHGQFPCDLKKAAAKAKNLEIIFLPEVHTSDRSKTLKEKVEEKAKSGAALLIEEARSRQDMTGKKENRFGLEDSTLHTLSTLPIHRDNLLSARDQEGLNPLLSELTAFLTTLQYDKQLLSWIIKADEEEISKIAKKAEFHPKFTELWKQLRAALITLEKEGSWDEAAIPKALSLLKSETPALINDLIGHLLHWQIVATNQKKLPAQYPGLDSALKKHEIRTTIRHEVRDETFFRSIALHVCNLASQNLPIYISLGAAHTAGTIQKLDKAIKQSGANLKLRIAPEVFGFKWSEEPALQKPGRDGETLKKQLQKREEELDLLRKQFP